MPPPPDTDWARSKLFKLVKELVNLPAKNRLARAKELERDFCNPENADIFTEEEAGYNASLLRKGGSRGQAGSKETYDADLLVLLYKKARRTVEVLSDHLLLSTASVEEDIADQLEKQNPSSPKSAEKRTSIILRKHLYQRVTINTVIMLLLRSKKLYQAMYEVRKILVLVLKHDEMFNREDGPIYACIQKYEKQPGLPITDQDESVMLRSIQFLQRISRRIAQFQQDHRIFKQFKFRGREHQERLLGHAKRLTRVLRAREAKSLADRLPLLDQNGCLQFVAQEPTEEDAEYYQNVTGQDTEPEDFQTELSVEVEPDQPSPLASPGDDLQQD